MSSVSLGKRLTHLRSILAAQRANPTQGFRAKRARATKLWLAVIARLEQRGTGTAANLEALLIFYQYRGFNLTWMLGKLCPSVRFTSLNALLLFSEWAPFTGV